MKRASNSLLTPNRHCITAQWENSASEPKRTVSHRCVNSDVHLCGEFDSVVNFGFPASSKTLQSITTLGKGEGRVRSSLPAKAILWLTLGLIPCLALAQPADHTDTGSGNELSAVDPNSLIPMIRDHLRRATSWTETELQISALKVPGGIEVPQSGIELRLPPNFSPVTFKNLSVPIEVLVDGKVSRTFWAMAQVEVRAQVLVTTQRISPGKTLEAADLEQAIREISSPRDVYVRTIEDAVGKVTRRSIGARDAVTQDMLTMPSLVRSGQNVRLRFRRGGVVISTVVRAEQNGKLGDTVRVRHPEFRRSIQGRVSGEGEVTIQ